MLSCVVYGCTNNSIMSDSSIKYYPFPKTDVAQEWAEACGWQSNALDFDTACICSVHFDENAYKSDIKMVDFVANYSKSLKSDAIPTLYLPHTQILIKDNSMAENEVVVYTINSGSSNDGITTISLEDDSGGKQIIEIQPSTNNIKVETQTVSLKSELSEHPEKYSDIKSYPDLYLLQADNKKLKRKVEMLEQEVDMLKNNLKEKKTDNAKFASIYKNLAAQIANRNMFSQQEQKVLLSKVFSEAQIKILFGKKKVYWSNDDMAVGYIIRHLSNKRCYSYLTKTLNIPLPGVSSIKRWVTAKKTKRIRS